jgi:hypothetical protein
VSRAAEAQRESEETDAAAEQSSPVNESERVAAAVADQSFATAAAIAASTGTLREERETMGSESELRSVAPPPEPVPAHFEPPSPAVMRREEASAPMRHEESVETAPPATEPPAVQAARDFSAPRPEPVAAPRYELPPDMVLIETAGSSPPSAQEPGEAEAERAGPRRTRQSAAAPSHDEPLVQIETRK